MPRVLRGPYDPQPAQHPPCVKQVGSSPGHQWQENARGHRLRFAEKLVCQTPDQAPQTESLVRPHTPGAFPVLFGKGENQGSRRGPTQTSSHRDEMAELGF